MYTVDWFRNGIAEDFMSWQVDRDARLALNSICVFSVVKLVETHIVFLSNLLKWALRVILFADMEAHQSLYVAQIWRQDAQLWDIKLLRFDWHPVFIHVRRIIFTFFRQRITLRAQFFTLEIFIY